MTTKFWQNATTLPLPLDHPQMDALWLDKNFWMGQSKSADDSSELFAGSSITPAPAPALWKTDRISGPFPTFRLRREETVILLSVIEMLGGSQASEAHVRAPQSRYGASAAGGAGHLQVGMRGWAYYGRCWNSMACKAPQVHGGISLPVLAK